MAVTFGPGRVDGRPNPKDFLRQTKEILCYTQIWDPETAGDHVVGRGRFLMLRHVATNIRGAFGDDSRVPRPRELNFL